MKRRKPEIRLKRQSVLSAKLKASGFIFSKRITSTKLCFRKNIQAVMDRYTDKGENKSTEYFGNY